MPSVSTLEKTRLTVTISNDVVNEIDKIAKEKETTRSQIMEELLHMGLLKFKKRRLEKESKAYCLSLIEKNDIGVNGDSKQIR